MGWWVRADKLHDLGHVRTEGVAIALFPLPHCRLCHHFRFVIFPCWRVWSWGKRSQTRQRGRRRHIFLVGDLKSLNYNGYTSLRRCFAVNTTRVIQWTLFSSVIFSAFSTFVGQTPPWSMTDETQIPADLKKEPIHSVLNTKDRRCCIENTAKGRQVFYGEKITCEIFAQIILYHVEY